MAALFNLAPRALLQGASAVSTPRITRRRFHCAALPAQVWEAITQVVALFWVVVVLGFWLLIVAGFLAG